MIVCQACGSQNLESSQFCDECGESLQKYRPPEPAETFEQSGPAQGGQEVEIPVYQSASVTSVGVPPVEEEAVVAEQPPATPDTVPEETPPQPPAGQRVHAKLVIERGQAIGTEFPLTTEESNIGRWDADNGVFPDVDLDAHDPEAKVSRRHARILYTNGSYMIEDLGSTNGTFVNRGRRLIPGNPHKLDDGDEIIVGKTFLRLVVLD